MHYHAERGNEEIYAYDWVNVHLLPVTKLKKHTNEIKVGWAELSEAQHQATNFRFILKVNTINQASRTTHIKITLGH